MRKINKIIIHCSATPEGRHVDVATIRLWHLHRGFRDIGYHYVIYLDGSIHAGRPVPQAGAHCAGHNANSIGVCYVGGVDAYHKAPKDTRTEEQKKALTSLLKRLHRLYPDATLHGHREFANKACPSFDVAEYQYIFRILP